MPQEVSSAQEDKSLCVLCRRNFSKYTCPRCNIPYCSLSCYRSEGHSQCTEAFYASELKNEIKLEPSRSKEEKGAMLDLLKRFEEEQGELDDSLLRQLGSDGQDEEEEEEEDPASTLAQRLKDTDLENASPEVLWSALSKEQQEAFAKVMQNPTSEQAQELLASESLHTKILQPWWEAPLSDAEAEVDHEPQRWRYGLRPSPIAITSALQQAAIKGRSLMHNVFAVSLAYAYTTRSLASSPLSNLDAEDAQTARDMISKVVPFVVDKRSTLLHTGVDSALTAVVSLLDSPSTALLRTLLRDSSTLLKPRRITEVDLPNAGEPLSSSYHFQNAILMLSDLHDLFAAGKRKSEHVTHKLAFYAAYASTLDPDALTLLHGVIEKKASEFEETGEKVAGSMIELGEGETRRLGGPLIEEIA